MSHPRESRWGVQVFLSLAALCVSGFVLGHEVEEHVHVRAYVQEEGDQLAFAVRVPLASIRDIQLPITPEGYLVEDAAEMALRQAATLWVMNEVSAAGATGPPRLKSVEISPPSDRSFDDAATAFAGNPLSVDRINWRHLNLDVRFDLPVPGDTGGMYQIESSWWRLGLETEISITFLGADGFVQNIGVHGGKRVLLRPGITAVTGMFIATGILSAIDSWMSLALVISIALGVSALDLRRGWLALMFYGGLAMGLTGVTLLGLQNFPLWFYSASGVFVGILVLWLALENAISQHLLRRPVTAALGGIVLGASLTAVLDATLPLAGGHFTIGGLGYLLGVSLVYGFAGLITLSLTSFVPEKQLRIIIVVTSVVIGHAAWHRVFDEIENLQSYFI